MDDVVLVGNSEMVDFECSESLVILLGRNLLSLIRIFLWLLLKDSEKDCFVKCKWFDLDSEDEEDVIIIFNFFKKWKFIIEIMVVNFVVMKFIVDGEFFKWKLFLGILFLLVFMFFGKNGYF